MRVRRLGAGVWENGRARPARIAAAVRRVLDDPEYGRAARSFAQVLAAEATSRPTAADEVERLVHS